MRSTFLLILIFHNLILYSQSSLYYSIPSSQSKITFSNDINEDEQVNILKYDYLYNGAGVGIGDFDRNGYPDIFLAGNMVEDQLYFNKGNFEFENVTQKAGITSNGWSTGVCVFDINNDGWDDIYVCRSGPSKFDLLENVLYENQGDGTFKEKAISYGLNIKGHHTQAAPIDIDLDGDLDLYLMGHPGNFKHADNFQEVLKKIQEGNIESDVLLENVGGQFIDITKEAGINEFGYGLGLAITDLNNDGYPDIIVCNDFDEPDHAFINQQNNTFLDENLKFFKHTSNYSMGNDVGDINNDGMLDYISVDMAFESHERSKTNMASMNPEKFFARVQLGWGYQYMHNMLHLNTGMGSYQEIAQFSGVAKTDWSWAPLLMDIDMDGSQDLFISNGYKRDTKNNDLGYHLEKAKEKYGSLTVNQFLELIPSVKIENFFFRNSGALKFQDKRSEWGVDEKVNSNGAAYADLDLDGDLDLILNNIDTLASVYENQIESNSNYLIVDLNAYPQADIAHAIFTAYTATGIQVREANFVRGFCSTVEKKLFFYSAENDPFVKLQIVFPDGKSLELFEIKSNSVIKLSPDLKGFEPFEKYDDLSLKMFSEVTEDYRLDAAYIDNKYNDFEDESLLPHMMTTAGPEIAVGDIDNNGFEDFVVTSPVGKIPAAFIQNPNGTFKQMKSRSFFNHQSTEDGDIHIFDVNGDRNLDLLISSGGYQWPQGDTAYENRLYVGNRLGMFGLVNNGIINDDASNSGKIVSEDIDGDGDMDFLICGKGYPKKYPYAGHTKIYINEKGFFTDKTKNIAPTIERIGMVNDACFSDMDGDGDNDLLVVGEWMKIEYFENRGGYFVRIKSKIGMPGWWTCIEAVDIDGDGDDDYILGNAGLNNKYNATSNKPLDIYVNDFDDNGSLDIVLAYTKQGYQLPVRGRECSSGQMPFIKEKFPTYLEYASSDLEKIYSKEKLELALHYQVNEFRSGILYNNEKGMSFEAFPSQVQFSFMNAYEVLDLNEDGKLDIIGVGNRFNSEVETTRHDAGCGVVLIQKEDGSFQYLSPKESGFYVPHNAKSIERIKLRKEGQTGFIVGNNNQRLQLFVLN